MKIIKFLENNMSSAGICYLANKNYYFGVGGNLVQFKERLEENGFIYDVMCKIIPKSGGNKKEILEIRFKNSKDG